MLANAFVFDSGKYETEEYVDMRGNNIPPGEKSWSEELYIETAKHSVSTGDEYPLAR